MSEKQSPPSSLLAVRSSQALARSLFSGEVPQEVVRSIPAQSLYLAMKQHGLGSSAELIELASVEQCRLMLDFDCWQKDQFQEDNFWEWLSLADDEEGLRILQKFIKFVDLKLVALLIHRHVHVVVFEEPTDAPPAPGHYTPDKGYTWLSVDVEDQHRHFMLSRLLALVFETNAELFYQLISIPQTSTQAVLEEESYQDKSRRLASEGIPEQQYAHQLNSPLTLKPGELTSNRRAVISDIEPVEPLLFLRHPIQPLGSMLSQITDIEQAQAELSLVMNAATVFFSVPFYEAEQVLLLADKVKGAINIGIEECLPSGLPLLEIFQHLGFQKLYRIGLGKLFALRQLARSTPDPAELPVAAILEAARKSFPEVPLFFDPAVVEANGAFAELPGELRLDTTPNAIMNTRALRALEALCRQAADRRTHE